MVKRETRLEARDLRQQGVSVIEISRRLGVSKGSVSVWTRDIQLTPQQIERLKENQRKSTGSINGARTNRERAMQARQSYQEQGRLRARDKNWLHTAGCMLYWSEGAKGKNRLYFVNSDPDMLLMWMRFLREEFKVMTDQIALYIQCHATDPVEVSRIEQYWVKLLGVDNSCLRKTHIKKGAEFRKSTLENGVCGVLVLKSTSLVQHVYGAIQEYTGSTKLHWQF